jgi:hypothetical protein
VPSNSALVTRAEAAAPAAGDAAKRTVPQGTGRQRAAVRPRAAARAPGIVGSMDDHPLVCSATPRARRSA